MLAYFSSLPLSAKSLFNLHIYFNFKCHLFHLMAKLVLASGSLEHVNSMLLLVCYWSHLMIFLLTFSWSLFTFTVYLLQRFISYSYYIALFCCLVLSIWSFFLSIWSVFTVRVPGLKQQSSFNIVLISATLLKDYAE